MDFHLTHYFYRFRRQLSTLSISSSKYQLKQYVSILLIYLRQKPNESRTKSPEWKKLDKKSEDTKLSIKCIIIIYLILYTYFIHVILYHTLYYISIVSYTINIYLKNVIVVLSIFIISLYFFLYFITSYYFLHLTKTVNGNPL